MHYFTAPACTIVLLAAVDTIMAVTPTASQQEKPNIILIVADDLGYNNLGCYGSSFIQSPRLDQLAKNGLRCTDFHSNGAVCSPTRAALMTGRYQQRSGIDGVVKAASKRHVGLALEEATVTEALKAHTPESHQNLVLGKVKDAHQSLIDMVAFMDVQIGRVVDHVESKGLAQKTLIVFMSDNGPAASLVRAEASTQLRGRKATIYEGGHRVPAFSTGPVRSRPVRPPIKP